MNYDSLKSLVANDLAKIDKKLIDFDSKSGKLNENLVQFLTAPSKRLRPLISLLFLKACGNEVLEEHISFLAAVELIHSASLIHDDVIDKSNKRRGLDSLNYIYDDNLAVISGDFLLAIAFKLISSLEKFDIMPLVSKTLENMCYGEIVQYFDKFNIPTLEKYLEKSKNKTAQLFILALKSSDILSGGKNIDLAENLGLNFGIAFQLRDDILNFSAKDGLKPVNSDVSEGIYTAPIIFANGVNNILYGIEKSRELLDNYIEAILKTLESLEENIYKKALFELVELLRYE